MIFAAAERAYSAGDYATAAERAKMVRIARGTGALQAVRAITLEARAAYQLGLPFTPQPTLLKTSRTIVRYGKAYRLSLEDKPSPNVLVSLRSLIMGARDEAWMVPIRALTLSLAARLEPNRQADHLTAAKALAETHQNIAEAWEAVMLIAITVKDYATARSAAEKFIDIYERDGHEESALWAEKLRASAILLAIGQRARAESELAEILNASSHVAPITRAQAYLHLGLAAFKAVAEAPPESRNLKIFETEVTARFMQIALAELEGHPARSAARLRTMINDWLAANYDFSGAVVRYDANRPDDTVTDPGKWRDFAFGAKAKGRTDDVIEGAMRAFGLSLSMKDPVGAADALHLLLPDLIAALGEARFAELMTRWEKAFGPRTSEVADPDGELARRRVLAMTKIVSGDHAGAALTLAAFLLRDKRAETVNVDRRRNALFELGTTAYWSGLYEVTAEAIKGALALTNEPSLRAPMLSLLRMEKVAAVIGGPSNADSSKPLAQTIQALKSVMKTQQDATFEIWHAATRVTSAFSRASREEVAALPDSDFEMIEAVYHHLKAVMAGSREFSPYRAGLAKVAAEIALRGQRDAWQPFWRNLVDEIRSSAAAGGFEDKVLRHDVERHIAKTIGDWRHVARSAAATARIYLDVGNVDITGFLLEIWEAQKNAGQPAEAALLTMWINESLSETRFQMAALKAREIFFRDSFRTYDRLLGSLEDLLRSDKLVPESVEFLTHLYFSIGEGLKARVLLDEQRLTAKPLDPPELRSRALFSATASKLLSLFEADTKKMPDLGALIEAWQSVVAPLAPRLKNATASLDPLHPARLDMLGLNDVRVRLGPKTALLTMVSRPRLSDDHGGLLLITEGAITYQPLSVFRWEQDVISPLLSEWNSADETRQKERLAFLYDELIRPFLPQLAGIERLIISPSGPFSNLPFGALWNRSTQRYLVQDLEIGIVPFANILGADPVPSKRPVNLLYAVNPLGSPKGWRATDWQRSAGVSAAAGRVLERLSSDLSPFAAAEDAALAAWPGRVSKLSAISATSPMTRETLLASLAKADIAHLSMHGARVPQDGSEEAVLMISTTGGSQGILLPQDVGSRTLKGLSLIVMSACEVGRTIGSTTDATDSSAAPSRWLSRMEEMSGFPTAFLLAGVHTTIAPVAEVPADGDSEIWLRFYGHIWSGEDAETALAKSQRDIITSTPHVSLRNWGLYVAMRGVPL